MRNIASLATRTPTTSTGTLAQSGFTLNGVGPISQASASDQFEIRLLASYLEDLGIKYYHRGYVFASSDQGSAMDWSIHRCTWGGRRFWLLSVPVDGKVEHYSDVEMPQLRHEGLFKEGLFFLATINPERAREILNIRPNRNDRRGVIAVTEEAARDIVRDSERRHDRDMTSTPFLPSKSA